MSGSTDQSIVDLANRWGWTNPPPAILAQAEMAVRMTGRPIGHAVVMAGLTTVDARERMMSGKPHDIPTLAWLADQIPSVREGEQEVLTLHHAELFLPSAEGALIGSHPLLDSPEVRSRCDEMDAALVLVEECSPLLLFSRYTDMVAFRRAQRARLKRHPMGQFPALGDQESSMRYGVAPRPLILSLLRPGESSAADSAHHVSDLSWRGSDAETPPQRMLARVLDISLAEPAGVSDIDIFPNPDGSAAVTHRVAGLIRPVESLPRLPPEAYDEVRRFLIARSGANNDVGRLQKPADGYLFYRGTGGSTHVRAGYIPNSPPGARRDLVSINLRLIPQRRGEIQTLETLGLHPAALTTFDEIIATAEHGLILSIGATGSGKSTTISAALRRIYQLTRGTKKIVSLEQPVEHTIPGVHQFSVHPHEGNEGFVTRLRALLRHDPDVIFIGEIRDDTTAAIAIGAALTGHLVLTTLHGTTAHGGVERLLQWVPPAQRYAVVEALQLAFAQRLTPQLCPHCRTPYEVTSDDRARWARVMEREGVPADQIVELPTRVYTLGSGCDHCSYGSVGRKPIIETLPVAQSTRQLLLSTDSVDHFQVAEHRNLPFWRSALHLVEQGEAAVDVLWRRS